MKKYFVLLTVIYIVLFLAGCPCSKENMPPTLQKVSGPDGVIQEGSSTFAWAGEDPEGSEIKFEYRKNGEEWTDYDGSTTYTWNNHNLGIFVFEVRAIDDKEACSDIITWNFTAINEMVLVEAGTFTMGDTWEDEYYEDETPTHDVTLTYDFLIGKYQVTFDEFDAFCEDVDKTKPFDWWGRNQRPVNDVSWWDAIEYCNWLSEKDNLPVAYRLQDEDDEGEMLDASGNVTTDPSQVVGYRLPTEAEWEYAARGGKNDDQYKYSGSNDPDEVAWYRENAYNEDVEAISTWPVGLLLPNALGIYDMSGNVEEWCSDFYSTYSAEAKTNPFVNSGSERVIRGGSYFNIAKLLRIASRGDRDPTQKRQVIGFRIAKTE
ncbi:MAG: SUMF1/EgtB/PvdO family nonheme iron enzyme [Kosmotogaceae bacterium]